MTSRPTTAAPILTMLAIVLVTLGAYVGGYYGLCEYSSQLYNWNGTETSRTYSAEWQCNVFVPAAWIEARVSGHNVNLLSDEIDHLSLIYSTHLSY